MPAQVCRQSQMGFITRRDRKEHTNFKVVLVRERILNSLNQRLFTENLVGHLVHGGLDTSAIILGKSIQGDFPGNLPGRSELVCNGADLIESIEVLPMPVGSNISAHDTVPGLLESGVLVTDETPELRAGALEHGQIGDEGPDVNALALNDVHLDGALLLAVFVERVRVGLAVNIHARPAVSDNLDMRRVNVVVASNEVVANDRPEQLGGSHWVLLGEDVDGVLDGVGCDNDAVVGLGVAVLH